MSDHVNPMPGNALAFAEMLEDSDGMQTTNCQPVKSIDDANVITSLDDNVFSSSRMHRPVLDIDFPAQLIPSSTPGHFHLYIEKAMTWPQYQVLLKALAEVGIIQNGYAQASIRRGFTAVRLPWIKKEAPVKPASVQHLLDKLAPTVPDEKRPW